MLRNREGYFGVPAAVLRHLGVTILLVFLSEFQVNLDVFGFKLRHSLLFVTSVSYNLLWRIIFDISV